MPRRFIYRFAVIFSVLGLSIGLFLSNAQDSSKRGRKYKSPPPTARVEVTILRNGSGKPIENAAVIFQAMLGDGDKGNMELKTNEDGKSVIDVLPLGATVRLQVIAKGFQTYGQDYKVDKPQMAIEVRMKRPGEQYSIYKLHELAPDSEKSPDTGKTGNASPEKPSAHDKPADDPKKPDGPPSPPQTN